MHRTCLKAGNQFWNVFESRSRDFRQVQVFRATRGGCCRVDGVLVSDLCGRAASLTRWGSADLASCVPPVLSLPLAGSDEGVLSEDARRSLGDWLEGGCDDKSSAGKSVPSISSHFCTNSSIAVFMSSLKSRQSPCEKLVIILSKSSIVASREDAASAF